MTQTTDLPRHIQDAVHTACSELPNAHPDDIADCVCGMISLADYDAHAEAIVSLIGRYV